MNNDSKQRNAALGIVAAVREIKAAILRTRYMAARLANAEMLKLYFGTGAYVSVNSRKGKWGTGAIAEISARLQQELPGLKEFSATSIKYMRIFFETWCPEAIRQLVIDELASDGNLPKVNRQSAIDDLAERNFLPSIKQANHQSQSDEIRPSVMGDMNSADVDAFLSVSFTHHIQIFSKCKTPEENPSIGIVLCREANRGFVEMAIRDMTKPMGVAVFRSDKRVPRAYRQLEPMLKGLTEIMEDRS